MASSVELNAASQPLAEHTLPTGLVTTTTPPPTSTEEARMQDADGLTSPTVEEPPRPQAGPLPSKRGEIGFVEGLQVLLAEGQASSSTTSLPERHPADRDHPASPESSALPGEQPPRSPSRTDSTNTANTASTVGKRSIISFFKFKSKRIPTVCGLRVTTFTVFFLQLALLGATIAGWVLTVQRMQKAAGGSTAPPDPSSDPNGNDGQTTQTMFATTSAQIFVHVAFGIVTLAELIFLERSLFRLRAERYAHTHPGEVLPSARSRAQAEREMAIGFAPWNRPPLPTYAAALAQSGLGTGDVEDNIIAIPPPPAYGNTRGSTLLLQGFLSDALRAQRPRSDVSSLRSWVGDPERRGRGRDSEDEQDRPKSYVSTDSEWEARCDADRALVLEETLSRLEEGHARGASRAGRR